MGGRCGDGGGADARFVGEKPPGDTVAQRPLQSRSGHAPGKTCKGEGILYDPHHGGDKLVAVEEQKKRTAEEIEKGDGGDGALA